MKIFMSYKFAGNDKEQLKKDMEGIVALLRSSGHQVWCSLEKQEYYLSNRVSNKQIFEEAFEALDASDTILVFYASPEISEGMLFECGRASAQGKRIVLAIRKGLDSRLRFLSDEVIEWETMDELVEKLKKSDIF